MTYEYSDPNGFFDDFVPAREKTYQTDGLVGYMGSLLIMGDKRYIVSAVLVNNPTVESEAEKVEFPNPKRGFIAITTFPPVYQTRNGNGRGIVVPRVFPPIYITPVGRRR